VGTGRFDLAGAFAEHEARVFTYFRRMVPGRENARDLTQETFYRALRGAHRYRGDAPVPAWLLGIARNVFLEWLRKHRREASPVGADPPGRSGSPGPEPDPVDVERALLLLDPEHREVLVLRFALDLSGEEVAAILGISHDAVRQRVARAKGEFRKAWEVET
jgi:RNA polymerase sigma-70 factor (ECF subfamily)